MAVFIIDESGFPKQGKDSVGVSRQYCGRLGKVDNCQVGVFLGYTSYNHRILLDKRLYLPEEWINDNERRKKCGVPQNIVFQTKAQLGLELIGKAIERGQLWSLLVFLRVYPVVDELPGTQTWLIFRKDEGEQKLKYQYSNLWC